MFYKFFLVYWGKYFTILAVVMTVFSASSAFSKNINLKHQGVTIKALVPSGWKVFKKAYGDLNHDGKKDLVFVLQSGAGKKILAIYFWNKRKKTFVKIRQMNRFITSKSNMIDSNPPRKILISRKGLLTITSFLGGASPVVYWRYRFRYRKGIFSLIGFDGEWVDKHSNEFSEYSYNLLSKNLKIKKTSAAYKGVKITRKKLRVRRLIALKSMVNGYYSLQNESWLMAD